MTYFNVSFQYSENVFCANIAAAEKESDVAAMYSGYEWCSIAPATEGDVETARKKGMPIVDCPPVEDVAPEKSITFTPDSVTVDNGNGNVSTVDRRSVPTRVKDFEKYFYVSHGNIKLKSNDETLFIIWSLPARITCPYRTEHCSEKCYAVKAETARPDVLPSRMRNFEFSKKPEFVPYMIRLLELKMQYARGRKIVVRVHESGDFYNVFYARKWLEIARHFVGENIVFMAYTKSLPFFKGENVPENFVIRASLWDDTTPELREESALYPVYTALSRAEMDALPEDSFHECRCSDCATCGKCWDKSVRNIICEIH